MAKAKKHDWRKFNEWRFPQLTETTAKDVYHWETEIFDAINNFKQVLEKSEWKKNSKINKILKDLYKLEAKLGDEIQDMLHGEL